MLLIIFGYVGRVSKPDYWLTRIVGFGNPTYRNIQMQYSKKSKSESYVLENVFVYLVECQEVITLVEN
jgi:hypothetical protein